MSCKLFRIDCVLLMVLSSYCVFFNFEEYEHRVIIMATLCQHSLVYYYAHAQLH